MNKWFGLGALMLVLACGDSGGSGKGSSKGDAGGGDGDDSAVMDGGKHPGGDGGSTGDGDSVGGGDGDSVGDGDGKIEGPTNILGALCDRQTDCVKPMRCSADGFHGYHQCVAPCASDDDCKIFGNNTRCSGFGQCQKTCSKNSDCPSHTICAAGGICANTGYAAPSCVGTPKPCDQHTEQQCSASDEFGGLCRLGCSGQPNPCGDIVTDEPGRCSAIGCEGPVDGKCTGTPDLCATRFTATCQDGCTSASCVGVAPSSCGPQLSALECSLLAGCSLVAPTSPAPVCGNGIIDYGEDCDGTNFGFDDSCQGQGEGSGTLTCGADCKFDITGCHACHKCACDHPSFEGGCQDSCDMLGGFCQTGSAEHGPVCQACIQEKCGTSWQDCQ